MALFILLGFLKSLVFRAEKAIKAKTKKATNPEYLLGSSKQKTRRKKTVNERGWLHFVFTADDGCVSLVLSGEKIAAQYSVRNATDVQRREGLRFNLLKNFVLTSVKCCCKILI